MVLTEALAHPKKGLVLILVKQRQKFAWVCITMVIIVIFLLIKKLKINYENVNFQSQFCLGSKSNKFDYRDTEEEIFKKVDYDSIYKWDILNNHKYFMVKNNAKFRLNSGSVLLAKCLLDYYVLMDLQQLNLCH